MCIFLLLPSSLNHRLICAEVSTGLVAPLVTSCCISIVALPYWWDKENSYWRKYGRGRSDN